MGQDRYRAGDAEFASCTLWISGAAGTIVLMRANKNHSLACRLEQFYWGWE
jgi:hypothetical protein